MRDILRFRTFAVVFLALGLFAGGLSAAGAQDDGDDSGTGATPVAPTGTGTLVVSKFFCDTIDEPTATVSEPVGGLTAAAGNPDVGNCEVGNASFEIYANGDFSADAAFAFTTVDGTATVDGIPAGDHALVETSTNVFFTFTIADGAVTTVTVLNPAGGAAATPAAPGGDTGGGGGGGDGTGNGGGGTTGGGTTGGGGTTAAAGGSVTTLPSTGQGSDTGSTGSIALVLGALSVVALAGGVAWRQRRLA